MNGMHASRPRPDSNTWNGSDSWDHDTFLYRDNMQDGIVSK
jgi:hypothetical protein